MCSSDMWGDVCAFNKKFDVPQNELPGFLSDELMQYRFKFLQEELTEFYEAYRDRNLVKAFDALIDLVYVTLGTARMMNVPWEGGWDHVQAANMSKVRAKSADESKRGCAVDVIKPAGWVSPEELLLAEIIFLKHSILRNKLGDTHEQNIASD